MSDKKSTSGELSWEDLQQQISWWAALFPRFFAFSFRAFRRQPALFLFSSLLFAGVSLSYLYLKSQKYEAITTFVYVDLHPKIFGDMTTKLQTLILADDSVKVGELLQLSAAEAVKIKGIKVTDSRGKPFYKNYSMRKEPMIIEIELEEPIEEEALEAAVTDYFNSNPFIADRLELKKKLLRDELTYIEEKLMTIDSILSSMHQQSAGPRSSITIEDSRMDDAYELLKFSRELIQRRSDIENGLINPETVFAIDNMIILPKARFTIISAAKFGIFGLALGALFALGTSIFRKQIP